MRITFFQSDYKISPFAPEWKNYIVETEITNIDFDKVKNILLEKEKDILKIPHRTYKDKVTGEEKISDGYTGLGNSTTARFGNYNVLKFEDEEFVKIKNNIIKSHDKFMKEIFTEKPHELYIQCWYNVLRKGQEIKAHIHDSSNLSYLGGHINVTTNDTYTAYIRSHNQLNEPDTYKIKTDIGKLTFFTSSMPHFTNKNPSDDVRITIAFDLFLNKRNDYCERLY